jgi:large subunit ribosomal protein L18
MPQFNRRLARTKRHIRVRAKVKGTDSRPRLCVFRSLNNIYAQIINDTNGNTLVTASSLEKDIKAQLNGKKKAEVSQLVGSVIAKRAIEKGVSQVAFDRGGYQYHGRVKALGEAARKEGLKF